MHKFYYLLSTLLVAGAMASCSENNDGPDLETPDLSTGLYIINNGNDYYNVPSSITAFDYKTGSITPALQDAFMAANGFALGEGARPALIYGSKMYIPMTDSNLIWVVDPVSLEVITSIRPEGDATQPREVVSAGGKVFASMFTGYVSRIDTVSLTIDKTIKTGPNAEQMAVAGGKLYVANSDGYNYTEGYKDCSISIIDLETLNQTKIQDTSKVLNPTDMATNGRDVFVICKGNYDDVPSTVNKIEGNEVKYVADGNYMTVNGDKLYVINDVYGVPREEMAFDVYNTVTLKKEGLIAKQEQGTESWVNSPAGIFADSVTGDIVILSYTLSDAGNAQYNEPCYANIYSENGDFKKRITCGVGALGVTFVHKRELK